MAAYYRHADPRHPFLWQSGSQPPARWHGNEEGPATYLADTPDGAWAEFVRHEEIHDVEDLAGVRRRIWAIELEDAIADGAAHPDLPDEVLMGGVSTYPACQTEARRMRAGGAIALTAPSAALQPGGARGQISDDGLREGSARDGRVLVLYGRHWPGTRAWACADAAAPTARHLALVRPLTP